MKTLCVVVLAVMIVTVTSRYARRSRAELKELKSTFYNMLTFSGTNLVLYF